MPYKSIDELPDKIKNNLPKHAQEIFRAAFNHAWEQYAAPESRRGAASREETTHRVAWAAVEKKYHKTASGHWEENEKGSS